MADKNKPKSQALAVPDDVMQMLADADKRKGFAPGTMYAIMQQEVGGKLDKFLADPTAYHYGLNKNGKRVAGKTGKISTAFGPLGILESTARDPGYGIKPLQNKSLAEQIRFSADYLAKRGMAAYGEGKEYARQVAARIPGGTASTQMASAGNGGRRSKRGSSDPAPSPLAAPDAMMVAAVMPDRFAGTQSGAPMPAAPAMAQMAQADIPMAPDAGVPVIAGDYVPPGQMAQAGPASMDGSPYQVNGFASAYGGGSGGGAVPMGADPWMEFQKNMQGQPVQVADLGFGSVLNNTRLPSLPYKTNAMGGAAPQPAFNPFSNWTKLS
jgi:hypothetical protein